MGLSELTQVEFNDINNLLELYTTQVPTDEEILDLIEKTQKLQDDVLFDKVQKAFKDNYPHSKLISISDPIKVRQDPDDPISVDGYYIELKKKMTNPNEKTPYSPDKLYLSDNFMWNINGSDIGILEENTEENYRQASNAIKDSKNEYDKIDNYEDIIKSLNNDMEKLKKFIAMDFKIEGKNIIESFAITYKNTEKMTPKVPNSSESDIEKD